MSIHKYVNKIKEEIQIFSWDIKEFILDIDLIDLERIKYIDKYQVALKNDI